MAFICPKFIHSVSSSSGLPKTDWHIKTYWYINFCNAFNSITLSSLPFFFICVNFCHTEIPVARSFTTCFSLYSVREYNKTLTIFCEHTTCLPHARTRGSKRNSRFLFAFHVPFMILYSTITSPSASSFLSRKILLHLVTLL